MSQRCGITYIPVMVYEHRADLTHKSAKNTVIYHELLIVTDTQTYVRAKCYWLCATFSDLYMQTGKFIVSPYISICWHLLMCIFIAFSAISFARLLTLKCWPRKNKKNIYVAWIPSSFLSLLSIDSVFRLSLTWCLNYRSSDPCHLNDSDWGTC